MHDEMWLHGCRNVIHLLRNTQEAALQSPRIPTNHAAFIALIFLDVKGMKPLCIPRGALHCSWNFTPLIHINWDRSKEKINKNTANKLNQ